LKPKARIYILSVSLCFNYSYYVILIEQRHIGLNTENTTSVNVYTSVHNILMFNFYFITIIDWLQYQPKSNVIMNQKYTLHKMHRKLIYSKWTK